MNNETLNLEIPGESEAIMVQNFFTLSQSIITL
jgi:hypothetical protein